MGGPHISELSGVLIAEREAGQKRAVAGWLTKSWHICTGRDLASKVIIWPWESA